MLDKKIETAINKQINHELSNAHAYQAVALYFEAKYMHGFAKWMLKQVQDERTHAQKFIEYLNARQGTVKLGAIEAPVSNFDSCAAAAKATLELEQSTTRLIYDLHKLAGQANDLATQSMLKWFIDEQVEEEDWATELTSQIAEVESKSLGGLFALDHRWGKKAEEAD